LGNMSKGSNIDWNKIEELLKQENDPGLKQVALLTMATHDYPKTEANALPLLNYAEKTIRYAAAVVLIQYKNEEALPVLKEILNLKYDVAKLGELNGAQVEAMKMSVLENVEKAKWKKLILAIEKVESLDPNVRVSTKAKLVLKVLKN
jgi:HEAT repeat protein